MNLFSAILKALPEGVLYGTYIINIVIVHLKAFEEAAETGRLEAMPKTPPRGLWLRHYRAYIINMVIVTF